MKGRSEPEDVGRPQETQVEQAQTTKPLKEFHHYKPPGAADGHGVRGAIQGRRELSGKNNRLV